MPHLRGSTLLMQAEITMLLIASRASAPEPLRLLIVLLLAAAACMPAAPALAIEALAANSCWFGDPAHAPAELPICSKPPFYLDLIDRFHLRILQLPTQGAGTIDFALTFSDEFMVVDLNFIPRLDHTGTGAPLSGAFSVQLSIDPFDTDYFFSANLSLTPPPADPPPEPAAIRLVQHIPEADVSLAAGNPSWVSLYREPDPLKSITLQGTFTLADGSLTSIHNGFEIFTVDPPEPVPAPPALVGAAMAFGCSWRLRRRLHLGLRLRRRSCIAPAEPRP